MSTVTPNLNMVKPAPLENFSRATYNNNLDLLDAASILIPNVPGLPASTKPKIVPIFYTTTTGAGGDVKGTALATDSVGVGGLWWSDLGVTFANVLAVNLTGFHPTLGFAHTMSVIDITTTRVKFVAWRLNPAGAANGYGSLTINGFAIGY